MNRNLAIAGFGRCGTSLVLQGLAAGGMPCIGEPPSFEENLEDVARALPNVYGYAFKWLDPRGPFYGSGDVDVVWLDRDLREQARSQLKFAKLVGRMRHLPSEDVVMASLRRDRQWVMEWLQPAVRVRFELLVRNPLAAFRKIVLATGWSFDVNAAAGVVIKRPVRCAVGMDLELDLLARETQRKELNV